MSPGKDKALPFPIKVGVFSYHVAESKRRAGMHWLAFALRDLNCDVKFFTAGLSPISNLKGDHRLTASSFPLNKWYHFEGLDCFKWYAPFHPVNLRSELCNRLSALVFKHYGRLLHNSIRRIIAASDVVIVESCAWLMVLYHMLRRERFTSRIVYRVSDDLELMGVHPVLLTSELNVLRNSDYVSVPNQRLKAMVDAKFSGTSALDHHGIHADIFDSSPAATLRSGRKHAVFVGVGFLDQDFIEIASSAFRDIDYHIIGPIEPRFSRDNVIWYGEIPFAQTVPILKAADIALSPLKSLRSDVGVFADSLKILQYTYLGLPIVVPEAFGKNRPNFITYHPNDASTIVDAINRAINFRRNEVALKSSVYDWKVLALKLIGKDVTKVD